MANDTDDDPEPGSKDRNDRMTELPDDEKPPRARSGGVDDGDDEDDQSPTEGEESTRAARDVPARPDETLQGVVGIVTRADPQGNERGEAWVEWNDVDVEDALFRAVIDTMNQKVDAAALPDRYVVDVEAEIMFNFRTGQE